MSVKRKDITLEEVTRLCEVAGRKRVHITVTISPEDVVIDIEPWLPNRVDTKSTVTADKPVLISKGISREDAEELEQMMKQPIDTTLFP